MAVANFFDRALMSSSQALGGADPAELRRQLDRHVVELAWDDRAARLAEGRLALDMAVRLLARLYPAMRLTPIGAKAGGLRAELAALAVAINPGIELSGDAAPTVSLVFGRTAALGAAATIYAGSDGWLAKVSTRRPQGVGSSALPFGAGAAACLGAANVFRTVFADRLPGVKLDERSVLSTFDFTTGRQATQGPPALDVELGLTQLAGAGAIGNAVIWALARTPGVRGVLHVIDHETVELSNLQRYVLAVQDSEGRAKVDLARESVAQGVCSITAVPFLTRFEEYQAGRSHSAIARVVVALDTARDRIAVQAALPKRALNAWTQVGDLGVSRHGFLGEEACLACLYLPKGKVPNDDEVIARALGLPTDLPVLHDLRNRLASGAPVGEAFVREAAERLGTRTPPEDLLRFAGEPLRQFYAKAVCGGLLIAPASGRPPIEAPLAFQSAMAGILLAAELVADSGELRALVATKTILDMTRPVATWLGVRVLKPVPSSGPRCICQDHDFVSAYHEKHGISEAVQE